MRPTSELVWYLNDYFAQEVWRATADLIGNVIISDLDAELRPGTNGLINSRIDFTRPPGVTTINENTIQLRIPGVDHHKLETVIDVTDPLSTIDLEVHLSIELTLNAQKPDPRITIAVFGRWGPLVGGLEIGRLLREKLRKQIAGIETYRFSRRHNLAGPGLAAPPISGVFQASYGGSRNPTVLGYCDILLVADGYRNSEIGAFDDLSDHVSKHFAEHVVSPFKLFSTGIRIWKMPLTVAAPTNELQRTAVSVLTDRKTMSFSNLARVAETGLAARAFFGHDPIIVFALREADGGIRANTPGPYVLLNLPPSGSLENTTKILVHELGHTPLGHYLADEYVDSSHPNKEYRGLEPRSRNVARNPLVGWAKWSPWSGQLASFLVDLNEGAYEHSKGIFRPEAECRMKNDAVGEFCKVCKEELTLGMLEWGHQRAGSQGVQGMVDLKILYLGPWTAPAQWLHLDGGSTTSLEVFSGGPDTYRPTHLEVSVLGTSVPKPWLVTMGGIPGSTRELVEVRLGTVIDVIIRHERGLGVLAANHPVPETSVRLVFDHERRVVAADLTPPTNLVQSVPLGEVLTPVVEQATGRLSLPRELWVAARLGGVRGFNLTCSVGFELAGPGDFARKDESDLGTEGEERRWMILEQTSSRPQTAQVGEASAIRMLPSGHYDWSARTTWRELKGEWVQAPRGISGHCFEIAAIPFDPNPQPPADPFGLTVVERDRLPSLPVGLRAFSWHPNDLRIKFQFQLRLQGDSWKNLPETGFLSRDPSNLDTLAVTGWVPFRISPRPGSSGDFYEWRARAIDEHGRTSAWKDAETPFAVYLPAQRPRTLKEFVEMLETLQRGMRGPRGPPLLFVAEEWPADQQTDKRPG